jgi:hypothetical protein
MYPLNNPSRKDGIDRTKKGKDKRLEDKTLKCTEWYLVVKMKMNKNTKRKGNEKRMKPGNWDVEVIRSVGDRDRYGDGR